MIDFLSHLNSEDRSRIQKKISQEKAEMTRLFALPDRFLARELMSLTRAVRKELPDQIGAPSDSGYDNHLIWMVIPSLAKSLGETSFTADEENAIRNYSHATGNFRDYVSQCLSNSSLSIHANRAKGETPAADLLSREWVNGNPITIALDRVVPPTADSQDWIARHMREICQVRFGHNEISSWSPSFQDYRHKKYGRSSRDLEQPSEVLDDVVDVTIENSSPSIESDTDFSPN